MSDPLPAPNFNLTYNVPPMDIGSGYAAGIASAGQSIGSAISALGGGINPKTGEIQQGIFGQSRAADETLAAMKQSGMLTQEQYDSVAGKSLATKQAMSGLFANQWLQEQATKRQLALEQGKGQVLVDVEHQKLLDTINAVRQGYGAAAGVQQGKLPVTPQGNQPQTNQVPAANLGQSPRLGSGSDIAAGMGTTTVPQPQVAPQPKLTIGPPIGAKEQVPPGARIGTLRGQRGMLLPDGTFRPLQ